MPPPPYVHENPILVWMLSLSREYTLDEYDLCFKVVTECCKHVEGVKYTPNVPDSFRHMMTQILPLLMMRHRRIPRSKWRDQHNANGKHWIEQIQDDLSADRFMHSMIGYHLCYENSLCGMSMTQGVMRKVINIGFSIKEMCVKPRGASVEEFLESSAHKLTEKEYNQLKLDMDDDTVIRRLSVILALKDAYIKAIGQPIGFDLARLDFNIPERRASGDRIPLEGWEFRVFTAKVGVARGKELVVETYQCASAFFRGTKDTTFIFQESEKALSSWVQFISLDQMIKVLPKLTA